MGKVVKETFEHYKSDVIADFVNNHSPYGENFQTMGDDWRNRCDFRAEYEAILILTAKTFLHCGLDDSKSHNTSPDFLEKLANKIAEYLSVYIMRKETMPDTQKGLNRLRVKIQNKIKKQLFDENAHISALKQQQEIKREQNKKSKRARNADRTRTARQTAQAARNFRSQINSVFIDAQNIPRK